MKQELDKLKEEIREYLKSRDFLVFHGYSRLADPIPLVHWDTEHYPDFKLYLEIPKQLDVKLIAFHHRELSPEFIDDTLDDLEGIELPADEFRRLEKHLHDLRAHEGSTCLVELSFTHEGNIYIYGQRADWYEEFLEVADEIEDYLSTEEEEEQQPQEEMQIWLES